MGWMPKQYVGSPEGWWFIPWLVSKQFLFGGQHPEQTEIQVVLNDSAWKKAFWPMPTVQALSKSCYNQQQPMINM